MLYQKPVQKNSQYFVIILISSLLGITAFCVSLYAHKNNHVQILQVSDLQNFGYFSGGDFVYMNIPSFFSSNGDATYHIDQCVSFQPCLHENFNRYLMQLNHESKLYKMLHQLCRDIDVHKYSNGVSCISPIRNIRNPNNGIASHHTIVLEELNEEYSVPFLPLHIHNHQYKLPSKKYIKEVFGRAVHLINGTIQMDTLSAHFNTRTLPNDFVCNVISQCHKTINLQDVDEVQSQIKIWVSLHELIELYLLLTINKDDKRLGFSLQTCEHMIYCVLILLKIRF